MINLKQRFTQSHPCPVCGGQERAPRGKGLRCSGFRADDAPIAFCGRVESREWSDGPGGAGAGWKHRLAGGCCTCGQVHGDYQPGPAINSQQHDHREAREPLAPDTIDAINRRILELCPLCDRHRQSLGKRSTAPYDLQAAERFGYGSLPREGRAVRELVASLETEFSRETLLRAPGFYERNGQLTMHAANDAYDAILIPGRDRAGRILSLTRLTTRDREGTRPKYQAYIGTRQAFTVAGEYRRSGRREIRLVEGLHKAHVASQLDPGVIYVGLPGVALHAAALDLIEREHPDVVAEALDGDKDSNPDVARAQAVMHQKLQATSFIVETATWEQAVGKGIDDVLAAGGEIRLRPLSASPPGEKQDAPRWVGKLGKAPWCSSCAPRGRALEQFISAEQVTLRTRNLTAGQKLTTMGIAHLQQFQLERDDVPADYDGWTVAGVARMTGQSRDIVSKNLRLLSEGEDAPLAKEELLGAGAPFIEKNPRTGRMEQRCGDLTVVKPKAASAPLFLRCVAQRARMTPQHGGKRLPAVCDADESHRIRKLTFTTYFCDVEDRPLFSEREPKKTTIDPGEAQLAAVKRYRAASRRPLAHAMARAAKAITTLSRQAPPDRFAAFDRSHIHSAGEKQDAFRREDWQQCPRCGPEEVDPPRRAGDQYRCGKCGQVLPNAPPYGQQAASAVGGG